MERPSIEHARALASAFVVLDGESKSVAPWVLNDEQIGILELVLVAERVIIGKGRQVGSSTVICFVLMLLAVMNPGLPIAIVADDQTKSNGLLGKIKAWLTDDEFGLGVALEVRNVESITLPNGASIDALTPLASAADGSDSRVGRSKSYAVVYASELAFWRGAEAVFGALTGTRPVLVIVDSTGAAGKTFYRTIYDSGAWSKKFVGVEDHVAYRRDPNSISDELWEELQREYHFTRRDTAAWWWHTLKTDIHDVSRMLREFPVTEDHMWSFREGQHVTKWVVAEDVEEQGLWEVYRDPDPTDPPLMGVDVAAGLGEEAKGIENTTDASTIYLEGWRTGLPYAVFRSYATPLPQFSRLVLETIDEYRPEACIIESNGIGHSVHQEARHLRCVVEQTSGDSSGEVHLRRDRWRDRVETGALPIGRFLVEEARQCVRKGRRLPDGRVKPYFEGHDDVMSAASFVDAWRRENPWRPRAEDAPPEGFVPARKRRRKRAKL